jgi:hypothetical protein
MKSHFIESSFLIVMVILSLSAINLNLGYVKSEQTNLVPALIAPLWHGFNRTEMDVFAWQGVDYVVWYGDFDNSSRDALAYAHSLGMHILFYVTALQEGISYVPSDDTWLQYNGTNYIKPPTFSFSRLAPYGPYVNNILLPRVQDAMNEGADGVLLDAVLLHPGCDRNPLYGWPAVHPELSFDQFRHKSTRDVVQSVFNKIKGANPNAILVVNNNNIFSQEDRNKYASFTEEWQDVSDGFLLEIVGTDPYDAAISTVTSLVSNERNQFGVTKPLWVLYQTTVDSRFKYLMDNAYAQNFGYWAYDQYLTSPGLLVYNRTPYRYDIQSSSNVKNVKFNVARNVLNFALEGPAGTPGTTQLILPRPFLSGEPMVLLDNSVISSTYSLNATHYFVQFSYRHGSAEPYYYSSQSNTINVAVGDSSSIPEFSNTLLILFLVCALSIGVVKLRVRNSARFGKAVDKGMSDETV